jgi:TetR/AcrR family transcriptional regulator, transcriptional repressor for nem operon
VARDGALTRQRILDAASRLVLERGFAATTVDAVLEAASTTKGAFFHHFPSKSALGRALVERYAADDLAHLDAMMSAAEAESDDPAEQLVTFFALFEDAIEELTAEQPGCLYVSFVQERQLVDTETLDVIVDSVLAWRAALVAKLEAAAALHPPRSPVDLTSLADLAFTIFEGGFILARTLEDPSLLRGQVEHLRRYVELLFDVQPRARTRTSETSPALSGGSSVIQTTT